MICDDSDKISTSPQTDLEPPADTGELFVPEPISRASLDTYTCGVSWSHYGDSCAVATDTRVHIFPDVQDGDVGERSSVSIKQAECLYDWCWARLGERDHVVTTGRYQPVHLYSQRPVSLQLEGSYKCINRLDELSHAFSLATDQPVTSLYCGLVGEVRVFDVSRPGRECWSHVTKGEGGQGGIISCLATSPALPVYAAGSYDRTVGVYSKEGDRLCVLKGHQGGVTQVTFTSDGSTLLSGGRKDSEIIAWDLRQPGRVLFTCCRVVDTNQTVAFTLSPCHKFLMSANTDGSVRLWELTGKTDPVTGQLEPLAGWMLHRDAVTGVSWHPSGDKLATATGQRHFITEDEDCEDSIENAIVIWRMGNNKS